MNQRNFILFLVGSMGLIGLQLWVSQKYAAKKPVAAQVAQQGPSQPSPVTQPTPSTSQAKEVPSGPTVSARNEDLTVTWSQATGAVVQELLAARQAGGNERRDAVAGGREHHAAFAVIASNAASTCVRNSRTFASTASISSAVGM